MCDSKNTMSTAADANTVVPASSSTTSAGRRPGSVRLLRDLHDIFDNYQSSKLLVWEIVRTVHPVHCAALLFVLENVIKNFKAKTLTYTDTNDDGRNGDHGTRTDYWDSSRPPPAYDYHRSGVTNNNEDDDDDDDECYDMLCETAGVVLCADRPTLSMKRCWRDYRILPEITDTAADTTDVEGNLTILGLVKLMQDRNGDLSQNQHSEVEVIVMHNLRTRDYAQFAKNVLHYLLPENMQRARYAVGSRGTKSDVLVDTCREDGLPIRFLRFYESISNCSHRGNGDGYYNDDDDDEHKNPAAVAAAAGNQQPKPDQDATAVTTRESRMFRTTYRPRPLDVFATPDGLENDYYVQPRYVGYHIVVNSTKTETRAYNRYGELMQNLLYRKKIDVHATFEAVLLPLDERGNQRSWRYVRNNDRSVTGCAGILSAEHFTLTVVDVLRVNNTVLVDRPFRERMRYAKSLAKNTDNMTVAKTCCGPDATRLWSQLQRRHHTGAYDLFAPVNGVFMRLKTSPACTPAKQFMFSQSVVYDFQRDAFDRLYGPCSLNVPFQSFFPLEMSETCTVVVVYAHDNRYYYTCRYDRRKFTFVHDARLDRVCVDWRERLRYRNDPIYVEGATIMPMGVAFVRVYHNANPNHTAGCTPNRSKRCILGYEYKMTTSMYDVPYEPCSWF
ncbi:hypothetical protein AGLY_017555 [Aphis glycines]|uniref:Uncharacterized protein n=1 Tax=Aphis glycines TaxID=307491 RepID=A0A6G0SVB0_APHGL|nr:hypothetical protein AGLY_017555 [Aphis glycines]